MEENPYAAPESPAVVGIIGGDREDLRKVATAQKGILVCILIYLGMVVGSLILPQFVQVFQIAILIVGLVSMVFVFMLATRVYGTGLGIMLGILAIIPCLGFLILLMVNQRATKTLQDNEIKVGLLGAKTPV